MRIHCVFGLLLVIAAIGTHDVRGASCGSDGVALQVLGSAGPVPLEGRASTSYLVWVDGRSRVLVDAGGGSFLRFADAGAKIEDLDLVALTHMHVDHVADVAALVKAGFFSERKNPLPVSGPSGNAAFPGVGEFLQDEFGAKRGAFRYLSDMLGKGDPFVLKPVEVKLPRTTPEVVLDAKPLVVSAAEVKHGPVPALGYLVDVGGRKIAFGGDQNGDNPAFWKMVNNADVLVMHLAIADASDKVAAQLHASPEVIAQGAAKAGVKRLVLGHLMPRSIAGLEQSVATIKATYYGPVDVAHDLECFQLDSNR